MTANDASPVGRFAGKSVIVTGASTGIGLGIARGFAEAGARVALAARSTVRLEAAVASLAGHEVRGFAVDVASRASVQALCEAVAAAFGGIDVLCANAGVYPIASIADLTEAQWDEVMDINAKGSFFCVQAALPYLRASRQGRVVLTSSVTGPITGITGLSHYGASKAAQLGFMRTAAIELARDGITVNAVLPGLIETEALAALPADFVSNSVALIPVGRIGQVRDIANAVMFFADPQAASSPARDLSSTAAKPFPKPLKAEIVPT